MALFLTRLCMPHLFALILFNTRLLKPGVLINENTTVTFSSHEKMLSKHKYISHDILINCSLDKVF